MRHIAFLFASLTIPLPLWAQEAADPLSAIDWLSQSLEEGGVGTVAAEGGGVKAPVRDPDEAPVAESAAVPEVSVRPLDQVDPDSLGLLPESATGLPPTLWQGSDSATLATLIRAESLDTLPALRDLFTALLLSEGLAPAHAEGDDDFFLARVDRLLDLGALEPAQALLELTDREQPELFRRWFDVTLLTGTEDSACAYLQDRPALTPTYPARIFCLARLGDWPAAALTLGTARTLGQIDAEEDAILSRFLDDSTADDGLSLPPPARPSPLIYRLREAIGEPIATAGLPRAFAHADLRPVAPWRSQIEAAERLARVGAIQPNLLFGLYTSQTPAASGGIWDRAQAIQDLEAALAQGPATRAEALAGALPPAWAAMAVPRAEVAFASQYGDRLFAAGLTGAAGQLAWRIALLSPAYERVALAGVPDGAGNALLAGIARGDVAGLTATDPRTAAVIAGFGAPELPATAVDLLDQGRLGELLLRVLAGAEAGLEGEPVALTEAIAVLRRLGLEDVARRAALQYLILPQDE